MLPRHLRGLLRHGFIVQVGHMLAGSLRNEHAQIFLLGAYRYPFNLLWQDGWMKCLQVAFCWCFGIAKP
jgi:hypothetical protein